MENDTNNENLDSTNGETLEVIDDSNDEANTKLREQNIKLFERAKKAEGFLKDDSGNWVKKQKPKEEIKNTEATPHGESGPKPSDILKADEFKLYRQGYTETEIDFIMHNGGMKSLADEKSPMSLGLKVAREQRNAEDATAKMSDSSGLSEVERKYTTEQLKNMTSKELEAILPHVNT